MKIFIIILISITLICAAYYIGEKRTANRYREQIAQLYELQNQKTLELNTKIRRGEADHEAELHNLAVYYQNLIESYEYDLAEAYQLTEEIAAWDEYIEFVPDPQPEIIEIIKTVWRDKQISDRTKYSYSDEQNGYYVDFLIEYDSKPRTFEITPQKLVFEAQKPITIRKTMVGVQYLSNEAVSLLVTYDVFKFLTIGGSAGWSGEPMVGIIVGYKF